MGSCVSVHKSLKLRLSLGSKNDKSVVPSPVKEKSTAVTGGGGTIVDLALKSQYSPSPTIANFRDSGSKDETFFDSQPWLESDCEDDFFSVRGDFTPSRGSTPVHHSFAVVKSPLNTPTSPVGKQSPICSESPSSDKKKRLSELFQERLQVDHDMDEQNTHNGIHSETKAKAKSAGGTPYAFEANSGYSSERTPNVALVRVEDESMRSAECCIPRFCSNNERKKKMIPVTSVG